MDPDSLSSHSGGVLGVQCTNEGARKVLIVGSEKSDIEMICASTGKYNAFLRKSFLKFIVQSEV